MRLLYFKCKTAMLPATQLFAPKNTYVLALAVTVGHWSAPVFPPRKQQQRARGNERERSREIAVARARLTR